MEPASKTAFNIEQVIADILQVIDREREREIISRRFGLYDRKETLEQIGELLGITRERVRQLEKAILSRLKAFSGDALPHIGELEAEIIEHLKSMGNVARISDLAAKYIEIPSKIDNSRMTFIASLSPNLSLVEDHDDYYPTVGMKSEHSEDTIKEKINQVVDAIVKVDEPAKIEVIAGAMGHPEPEQVRALASASKKLASLNNRWGLIKWPLVNPKNIRDKIYVILYESGKPMHFSDLAKQIRNSTFKRRDVTTQAIHNELIKDSRFVLVGRGIYALKEWGYNRGTVADVISEVLKDAGKPLHRDEIVKQVLQKRLVKETTILLNLQGKPQFQRTSKATYGLKELRK